MKQFSLCLTLLVCAFALHAENPAPPAPKVTVSVDTTDAPDLKDWSEKAKSAVETFYPTLAAKLGLDEPREIVLVVKKDVKGAGSVDGSKVMLGAEHFKNKPDDLGTAIFLIVRGMQNYKAADNANWVITGIADYIRWHAYEPEKRELINPKTARFSNGFGDAAAFLAWIEKAHDKDVIRKLHTALKNGTYSNTTLRDIAGKGARELWPDFLAALRKDFETEAAKKIDPTIPKPIAAKESITFTGVGEVAFTDPKEGQTIRYTLDGSFPTPKSLAYCVPVRVASSLKVRAATYTSEGKCSEIAEVNCVSEGEGDKLTVAINVDASSAPDLKEWAVKAQKDCTEFFPTMVEMLKSDGFKPNRQIIFYFMEEARGLGNGVPAYALSGEGAIYFHAAHIRRTKNDFGMAIHELCHIVQNYGYSRNSPSWLVEGIADWVRWENWEPVEKRRRVDPLRAKYTNGYSDTARFLTWLKDTHDKDVILKLNAALRVGKYNEALFKESGKKEIAELWKDFVATLQKK